MTWFDVLSLLIPVLVAAVGGLFSWQAARSANSAKKSNEAAAKRNKTVQEVRISNDSARATVDDARDELIEALVWALKRQNNDLGNGELAQKIAAFSRAREEASATTRENMTKLGGV